MGTARRQYTDEFKREALGLLASSGRPLSQIAQELGIPAARLRAGRNTTGKGQAGSPRRPQSQAAIPLAGADLAAENAACCARTSACAWNGRSSKKTLRIFSEAPK